MKKNENDHELNFQVNNNNVYYRNYAQDLLT